MLRTFDPTITEALRVSRATAPASARIAAALALVNAAESVAVVLTYALRDAEEGSGATGRDAAEFAADCRGAAGVVAELCGAAHAALTEVVNEA